MRAERRRRAVGGGETDSAPARRGDRFPGPAGAPGENSALPPAGSSGSGRAPTIRENPALLPAGSSGSGRALTIRTPAKINLGLRVLGRRPDGYHRIRTRLAAVALWDTLTLEVGGSGARLEIAGPEASGIPTGPENLVLRAAERIERARRRRAAPGAPLPGIRLRLWKEIPAGRGLGGGSSDAAATLIGFDRLLRLGLSRSTLHRMAAAIGMDVPFFLYGGAALAGGRGDAVFPLAEPPPDAAPGLALVLLLPAYGVGTADAYRGLPTGFRSPNPRSPLSADAAPAGRIVLPSGGFGGRGDLLGDLSFPSSRHDLRNDLEQSAVLETLPVGPSVPAMRRALDAEGALVSALSGSGSAVFGVFGSPAAAERAARRLDGKLLDGKLLDGGRPGGELPGGACRAVATRTLSREEPRTAGSGVSP